MMNANELRINNWVEYEGRYFQLYAIDANMPFLNTAEFGVGVVDYNNIFPIPLSPEILEKCGFVWSIYHQAFHKHNDGHETYDLNECYPSGYQFSTFKKQTLIGIPVQSLHQLQNLYFSLCGEELNYTQ